eukprot:TRINITY_DN137_c0_g1_i1.p1 TRINITY_DN137_c0_g1~~TRINITY_DN137_c0_g1_i1.p1  ORF type:complete len:203 (+),score=45.66 TRINITY_DN137_c0_g1_i1:82-690(+)
MADKNTIDYSFSILIVGEAGAGKSCILLKYVDGTFTDTFISTIGVDFKVKYLDLDDRRIKLQIWDTAGQERYRAIVSSFYRGAAGILVVFDLTDINSFLRVQNWLADIKRLTEDGVRIVLVGSKCDLTAKRMVEAGEAKSFAAKHNLEYFETSAKTGEGIADAFTSVARQCVIAKVNKKPTDAKKVTLDSSSPTPNEGGCGC